MKTGNIDHVTTMAKIGEAIVALVKESGLLRKKPGRKRGAYKKRRRMSSRANGADRTPPRRHTKKRPLAEATTE